jgi:hypothetical protein
MTDLEFVNDWSELEAAIAELKEILNGHAECDPDYCDIDVDLLAFKPAAEVINTYVPRLLTQYAKLVELSFALTEGWEQYATLQAPSGLYLPDHR